MNFITLKYQVNADLVNNPQNEGLFTLKLLGNVKEVYDKILEKLTPIDIKFLRDEEDNKEKGVNHNSRHM